MIIILFKTDPYQIHTLFTTVLKLFFSKTSAGRASNQTFCDSLKVRNFPAPLSCASAHACIEIERGKGESKGNQFPYSLIESKTKRGHKHGETEQHNGVGEDGRQITKR